MKKKLIVLLAVCSMVSTAAVGMVQTAYAADASIRVEVTDGATDNQKVLTYYYENVPGIMDAQLYFDIEDGVTIDAVSITVSGKDNESGIEEDGDTGLQYGYYMLSNEGKAITSADGSFITATITVPDDATITAVLTVDSFRSSDGVNHDIDPVEVEVQASKPTPPEPVVAKSVEDSAAYTVADGYDADVVVGTIQLSVTGAAIDLTAATYKGETPTKVTGDKATSFEGEALITVIINGETSTDALNQVVFY